MSRYEKSKVVLSANKLFLAQRVSLLLLVCFSLLVGQVAYGEPTTLSPISVESEGGVKGEVSKLVKPTALAPEGSKWNHPQAVVFEDQKAKVFVSLPAGQSFQFLTFQGDNNDSYIIEAKNADGSWSRLWTVPPQLGTEGLVTRSVALERPIKTEQIRIRPGIGDGAYSVSHIGIKERIPDDYQPEEREFRFESLFSGDLLKVYKATVPLLLLICILFLKRASGRSRKFLYLLTTLIGLFGGALYFNAFTFHSGKYTHTWDFSHYYLGAKYFPELGYTCLYDASSVAEEVSGGAVRNLRTNIIGPNSESYERGLVCKEAFSKERWLDFKKDIGFFRKFVGTDRWQEFKRDHGFNAAPAWLVAGRGLTSFFSPTRENIRLLTHIDSALIFLSLVVVFWAFGLVPCLVVATFVGCNFTAGYYWTGGSLLRMDWFFYLVAGICCLKKRYFFLAGILLSAAIQIRIFPIFLLILPAIAIVYSMVRERRFRPLKHEASFIGGGILMLLLLGALAIPVSGRGLGVYTEFKANCVRHLETALTNDMGLATFLSQSSENAASIVKDPDSENPYLYWKQQRAKSFERNEGWYAVILVVALVLGVFSSIRRPLYQSAALGVALIPFFSEITCYYYVFFAVWGLLESVSLVIPISLLLVAHLSWVLSENIEWYDSLFAAESFLFVMLAVLGFLVSIISKRDEQEV